ncbi:LuxR family two component transcriptional regulator [Aneurinibacillus soli]|uniref:Oxygen regulatory protein NreC n=1 Tax=Aneurinibacillus soli TaxID=1500254 RepID=A0A0U5BLT7_9BACL|nr:response regulator transcription factor [Aneurinibacillus soli]PYE59520.1 LuxR family two component transcriptional regulator [Aneurinibacillus soli]BAU29150.1 Oxygen regulatory protein NreC [Aneurinibacillus soli]
MQTINILLIEDHVIVRSGLTLFLHSQPSIKVIGEAADGQEGLKLLHVIRPDLIITDLSMPKGMDGFTTLQEIRRSFPSIPVLILTMYDDEIYVKQAIRLGAHGLVLKQTDTNQLLAAIHAITQGHKYFDTTFPADLIARFQREVTEEDNKKTLTAREEEIVRLTARGYTNKEISEQLFISVKTVENHKTSAMKKLQLTTRADLVQYAIEHGMLHVYKPT